MHGSAFLIWLFWALFACYLVWLLFRRYRRLVFEAEAPLPAPSKPLAAPPAWLYCEDGPALDRRVQWFALRPGGETVIGHRPRAATSEASYVYLSAEDIREDHAVVSFDPQSGRYLVRSFPSAEVQHNNEPLEPDAGAELADGDTLDFGRISRFRFTLTGPEE